jgi:F420-dependent oxidoreductase-like protein
VRIGLSVKNFTWPGGEAAIGSTLTDLAQQIEGYGGDSFWMMDHFYQIPKYAKTAEPTTEPMVEVTTALSFVTGRTERLRVGAMVMGVTHRHPAIAVKAVTALDVLSGGRAYFGIGAAWHDSEHAGFGVPFPALSERFERLEEQLQIAHRMWSGDATPFEGKHYQLANPTNFPPSVTKPRPPILIGGGGERKTLRLVAQYADACNLFDSAGLEPLSHKLDVLREHCTKLGRPYDEIEKTVFTELDLKRTNPEQAIAHYEALAELGVDHIFVEVNEPWREGALVPFGEDIIPAVQAMKPAGREKPLFW